NAVSARRHHLGARIGPFLPWLDQPQTPQAEIRHGAGGGADILAKLRLHQHDDGAAGVDPALAMVGSCAGHCLTSGFGPAWGPNLLPRLWEDAPAQPCSGASAAACETAAPAP